VDTEDCVIMTQSFIYSDKRVAPCADELGYLAFEQPESVISYEVYLEGTDRETTKGVAGTGLERWQKNMCQSLTEESRGILLAASYHHDFHLLPRASAL
jgi:hypothetical protein